MKPSEWKIYISWAELVRDGDRTERVEFGKVLTADTYDGAKTLYARARQENGWVDANLGFAIQIDVRGPGIFTDYRTDPDKNAAGIASVRAALSKCSGPMMNRLQEAVA